MFGHIFFTRIKCLVRDKQLIFWSLIFPIILATLFKLTFANISNGEVFKPIDIAVVSNQFYENDHGFRETMKHVSEDGHGKLFNMVKADEVKADELLKNNKISGYIYLNPEVNLVVKSSGLNQSIIKTFLDNYKESKNNILSITKANPSAGIEGILKDLHVNREYTYEVAPSGGAPNTSLSYFYSLIALACLYGGFLGLKEITDIQADLSKRAARVNMAPVHKMKMFAYGILAALLIQFAEILILLGYLSFVLRVDFGNQLPYILLLSFVGGAAGISIGTMISACIRKGEGIKIGILITVSLISCSLAGMYYAGTKYIIEKKAPFLAYINPATLITDGLYTLYYYNTYERYFLNVAILTVLSIIFCLITYLIIRRQKYASL